MKSQQSITNLNLLALKESFVSQTGFLFIATLVGYIFGYLYLIFMGRALSPEDFGIFGALAAIFYIACLVGQSLRQAIATRVAEIKAKAGESAAVGTYVKLGAKLCLLCLLPALFFIFGSRNIASFFHLSSNSSIIVLGLSLSTALILEIVMGLLQGLQNFSGLGISGYMVSQGLKFLLGITFVWVGWDLLGAVGALLASTTIAIAAGLILIRKPLANRINKEIKYSSKLYPIVVPTLILAVFIAMPTSIDVMLVTHFFSATKAGIYNATAILGKVVIFLPIAVSLVLLPKATENQALGLNSNNILRKSLLLASLLSGILVLAYWLFPGIIIKVFFGEAYLEAINLVGWYGIAMLLFSLNFVLINYSLAIRNLKLMLLADLITLTEVVAIVLIHRSLTQIILILLFGNLLLLLLISWSLAASKKL